MVNTTFYEVGDKLIDETRLRFLMRRYIVQKIKKGQITKAVYYLPMYQEFGLRRKGIKFSDQDLC